MADTKFIAGVMGQYVSSAQAHIGHHQVGVPAKELITRSIFGRKKLSDSQKEFVVTNTSATGFYMMPQADKELTAIESKARRACYKREIISGYIPDQELADLKKEFYEQKALFFAKRDEVAKDWDVYYEKFSEGLLEFLKNCGYGKRQIQKYHKSLMAQLPTKQQWLNSFYMTLEIRNFAVEAGKHETDEEFDERINGFTKRLVSKTLTKLFEKAADTLMSTQNIGRDTFRIHVTGLVSEAGNILNLKEMYGDDIVKLAEEIVKINPDSRQRDSVVEDVELVCGKVIQTADNYDIFLNLGKLPETVTKEYLLDVVEAANK